MYGLVNAAVQELVESRFGVEAWGQIRQRAGVPIAVFSRMDAYPDAVTFQLVAAASEVLGLTPDQVMEAFGEFWVLYTGREGYGHLFAMGGDTLREFLLNLDELHSRVGQNFAQLRPPSFQFEEAPGGRLLMHYLTEREGLCPMVRGLLWGLAQHFRTALAVEHPRCRREGAAHCEFLLQIGGG
jgi:predicted hydrocarbon binding protein